VSLTAAATLPMNGLTVRAALGMLALPGGSTLAVTGSAGAVGGYAIQLGTHDGLTVVADAWRNWPAWPRQASSRLGSRN
jgi:NADPH:quinone reductase-like Zn-dependent oxidoreductase